MNEYTQNIDVPKPRSPFGAFSACVGVAFVLRGRIMRGGFGRGAVRSVACVRVFLRLTTIVRMGMSAVSMS